MFFYVLQRICDEKGISVSAFLDQIGMSRGNMARWKDGLEPKAATKKKIADALGVSPSVFEEEKPVVDSDGFTEAERLDIAREVERMMADIENQGDLMFDGDPATPEALQTIRTAFEIGLTNARRLNKEKQQKKG